MQNCRILPQVHSVSAREFIQQSWYSFDNPSLVALTWETREQCTKDSNYTETDTNQRGGLQISKHYTHHHNHHHQAGLILVHCDQARRKRVPIHINFSHPRPTQVISPQCQSMIVTNMIQTMFISSKYATDYTTQFDDDDVINMLMTMRRSFQRMMM